MNKKNRNDDQDFPADALDRWVCDQTPPEPSAEFVDRCLATIPRGDASAGAGSVCAAAATVSPLQRANEVSGDLWKFAVAAAAVAMLWINLSMSATQATDFGFRRSAGLGGFHESESIEVMTEQIRELLPELPPEEARRQAVLLRASEDMSGL